MGTFIVCILINVRGLTHNLDLLNAAGDRLSIYAICMLAIGAVLFVLMFASVGVLLATKNTRKRSMDRFVKIATTPIPGHKSTGTMTADIKERLHASEHKKGK